MTRSLSPGVEAAFWSLLTALGYFLLAGLSLYATKGADNIAAVWPPSGYFLALLLLMPTRAQAASFVGMATASLTANLLGGAPLLTTAAFTLANACEAYAALWWIRRREAGEISFMDPRSVGIFCTATLLASALSASIATALGGTGIDFFFSWLTTVALGMLIVTPPIVMLARMIDSRALDNIPARMKSEAILILTAAAAVTATAFSQSHFPVTFLPAIAVVAAAYRLGPFGAATGMLIVTIIASLLTGQGTGPIAAIDDSQKVKVLFLQFYLLALLFTTLPLAALLVVQRRLAKRLEQSNRWLVQAEAAALVGHWRVDLVRWTIQWSDQAYRIHGLDPGTPVDVHYSVQQYVDEDAAAVRKILAESVRTGQPFEYQGRIRRTDGEVRHVKSHGSIEMSRGGQGDRHLRYGAGRDRDGRECAHPGGGAQRGGACREHRYAHRAAQSPPHAGLSRKGARRRARAWRAAGGGDLRYRSFQADQRHARPCRRRRRDPPRRAARKGGTARRRPGRAHRRRRIRVHSPAVERASGRDGRRTRPQGGRGGNRGGRRGARRDDQRRAGAL
jgi:integral membrane sensor domain MASE1